MPSGPPSAEAGRSLHASSNRPPVRNQPRRAAARPDFKEERGGRRDRRRPQSLTPRAVPARVPVRSRAQAAPRPGRGRSAPVRFRRAPPRPAPPLRRCRRRPARCRGMAGMPSISAPSFQPWRVRSCRPDGRGRCASRSWSSRPRCRWRRFRPRPPRRCGSAPPLSRKHSKKASSACQ